MGKFDNYINVTAPLHAATINGKLGNANELFLEGDTQNVENELKEINSRHEELNKKHDTLSSKHESLSKTVQGIAATGGASTAINVTYNNNASGLNAENVQDAINELQVSKIDKTSILQESGEAEDKVMSQKAVSDKLSDLELNVDDFKDGFSKNGNNIFNSDAMLFEEGYYCDILNGIRAHGENANYNTYRIPINGDENLVFSNEIRFIVPTQKDQTTTTTTAPISNVTTLNVANYPNTKYLFIAFNINNVLPNTLKMSNGAYKEGVIPPNWYKDGLKDIHFDNIKGKVKADMMEGYENSNIFSSAELYAEGYYVNIIDGHIHKSENPLFNTYIIEVEPTSKYTFTNLRFALPLASDKYTAITSSLIQDINTIDMSLYDGVKYLAFSFNKNIYPFETFVVSKGEVLRTDVVFPSWVNDAIDAKIIVRKVPFLTTTRTTLTNGQYFVLPSSRTNLRKGMRVVATADVTGTGGFEIGFTISDKSITDNHNTISINDTQAKFAKNGYTYQDTQNHGLNISGKIVVIFEYNANGTATYTILANGKSFKHTLDFLLYSVSAPYLMSNGVTLTDCKLTLSCTDIEKKIWCFGDSYFAYSAKRWTYYLREYGYDKNVLLDGFPGEGGINGNAAFTTLLSMGTPKYAIWFLGMNDGSDPNDTTPSTKWAGYRDNFLSLCNQHGVTPVFATIPNVPSINHNGKNAWIKASGYRYIDMCHAVGADVNVNWLGTMLSSDKIHPSEDGARALFAQVIQDFPEVMVEFEL